MVAIIAFLFLVVLFSDLFLPTTRRGEEVLTARDDGCPDRHIGRNVSRF